MLNFALHRSLLAASLLLALAACGTQGEAPQQSAAAAVTVVTLTSEPITLTRELPGRISPLVVAEVRPQVTGLVEKLLFTEGSMLEAGQPLYQIDDATYRADAQSARAAFERAKATLNASKLSAERMVNLAKIDAVSQQDLEDATSKQAQAAADVGVARAALQRSEVVLGHTRITSPISGRIGKSSVTRGALVTASQAQALATVQQLDPIYVDLTQSSTDLLQLRRELSAGTLTSTPDVPVTILLEDGSEYQHAGKLAFADISVDPTTGSYLLRVVVPNPDNILLPGMYVRAVVSNGKREDGLLVPQQGITRTPTGAAVAMVVGADNKVEQRTVKVNRTIGDSWLVDDGLQAGDRVIVAGLQKIQPGADVIATERADDASNAAAPADSTPTP